MAGKTKRSGAAALVEALAKAGVEVVFGYPGGNVVDVFDELSRSHLRFVLGRHEQGLVHMADGYARASGRPGVVIVTSGPGLTNTITGLGAANMDGVPLVVVCGQVPLDQIGTDAFQEADTTGLTRSVSKYNFLVHSADEIPATVAAAFYIATHGKPGPVVIDIPRDIQRDLTAAACPERVTLRSYHPECAASISEVSRFAKLVNCARRPLICAGGGIIAAGAAAELAHLAAKADIPVVTTMMGVGAMDERSPLALGLAGRHGTAAAVRALAAADLVIALGVRFNDRVTGENGRFAPKAALVQVDVDPAAIGKNVPVELGIVADLKDFLATVDSRIRARSRREWLAAVSGFRPRVRASRRRSGGLDPLAVMAAIDRRCAGEAIIATDVGQHQLWAVRCLTHVHARNLVTSGGMGAMGFGIPAAIGAAIARPGERVVAIVGDGGAQMTASELIVAAELGLSVVFVVLVNRTLGLVRQIQDEEFGARHFATDLAVPDFVRLAAAYGVRACAAGDLKTLERALAAAFRAHAPCLIAVTIDPEAKA